MRNFIYKLLRKSESYTHTDMVYLTRGGFWLILGQIISFVSTFTLATIFANLLPKETYGSYKYILSIFAILSIFSLKSMGVALSQAIARGFEGDYKKILKIRIKWGYLGTLASFLVSGYYYFQNNQTLAISFIMIGILLPFFNSFNLYQTYLGAKKLFDQLTKHRGIIQIISTLVIITTVYFTNNLFFILVAFLLSETLLRLFFFYYGTKKYPPNNKKDPDTISYGKHLSFIEIIKTIAGHADKILVYHYIGAPELAIYAIASAPVDQMRTFVLNLRDLAFPKLSKENALEIKKTLPIKIVKASLLTIPIIILYILLAPWLFNTFFPEYQESVRLSQILSLVVFITPVTLLSSTLSAKKQLKALYRLKIWGALGRLVIYFICIKFYGLIGLIFGRIIIDIYFAALYNYYFNKMK